MGQALGGRGRFLSRSLSLALFPSSLSLLLILLSLVLLLSFSLPGSLSLSPSLASFSFHPMETGKPPVGKKGNMKVANHYIFVRNSIDIHSTCQERNNCPVEFTLHTLTQSDRRIVSCVCSECLKWIGRALVTISGTCCYDWSTYGARKQLEGPSSRAFAVWIASVLFFLPDWGIHENVFGFDTNVLKSQRLRSSPSKYISSTATSPHQTLL